MADKRFKKILTEGAFETTTILLDQETGVNYLFHASGYAGGLTPLLGPDGKPIIGYSSGNIFLKRSSKHLTLGF